MRVADAAATARVGTEALVAAAGTAVALQAQAMLTSCYGARVAVIVGPGLNGADGRVAAAWLRSRGAKVSVVDVANQPASLEGFDLVVDAAFGLGCSRAYEAPSVSASTLVLAVDLPSGVDADTGALLGAPVAATVTLALGALKPGLLTGPATAFVGELLFAGLGIVEQFDDGVVEDSDLHGFMEHSSNDHKWTHAVQVLAGSALMPGAADLVVRGAMAGGASMIRLTSRDAVASLVDFPPEVVHGADATIEPRCHCVVAGPGLGAGAADWLRGPLASVGVAVVLDADGLDRSLLPKGLPRDRRWILTPHEGEFTRLTGEPIGDDRFAAVRSLARATNCVVLLKGPATIIAEPDGRLRVVRSGTSALATAGSGDVLAGLIGATVARGHEPFEAASLAAHLHGRAGSMLSPYARASQIPDAVSELLRAVGDVEL
jgi:hydroxyethylthiazole kinase-like uncharacterized protein yjeF